MSLKSMMMGTAIAIGLTAGAWAGSVEDELLAVDRAFNKMAQEEGVGKAFAHFAAPDARMYPNGGNAILGHEAVAVAMGGFPGTMTLVWDPVEAVAAASGDMGFTWGKAVRTATDKDGNIETAYSKYVSIWQKQPDGSWKWSVDIGTDSPPPAE